MYIKKGFKKSITTSIVYKQGFKKPIFISVYFGKFNNIIDVDVNQTANSLIRIDIKCLGKFNNIIEADLNRAANDPILFYIQSH
ncbi:MAG: hypothetical protein DRR19_04295 [Candidatus Parabeggiatoa sp. nov. 1]|nr:MAG: hypothetical protein DRR19_04295 [Gammaproteobacteria bacterium]